MTESKVGFLLCLIFVAVVEPLAIPYVLLWSAIASAIGGAASARLSGIRDIEEIATHSISMSLFGVSIAMISYWNLETASKTGYPLIGIAGLCGLIGISIFEPLTRLVTATMDSITEGIIRWIKRITNVE
jgi:hypothetical protein